MDTKTVASFGPSRRDRLITLAWCVVIAGGFFAFFHLSEVQQRERHDEIIQQAVNDAAKSTESQRKVIEQHLIKNIQDSRDEWIKEFRKLNPMIKVPPVRPIRYQRGP
jgi:glutathione S-transferase